MGIGVGADEMKRRSIAASYCCVSSKMNALGAVGVLYLALSTICDRTQDRLDNPMYYPGNTNDNSSNSEVSTHSMNLQEQTCLLKMVMIVFPILRAI
jgi:hypothetical protein